MHFLSFDRKKIVATTDFAWLREREMRGYWSRFPHPRADVALALSSRFRVGGKRKGRKEERDVERYEWKKYLLLSRKLKAAARFDR